MRAVNDLFSYELYHVLSYNSLEPHSHQKKTMINLIFIEQNAVNKYLYGK